MALIKLWIIHILYRIIVWQYERSFTCLNILVTASINYSCCHTMTRRRVRLPTKTAVQPKYAGRLRWLNRGQRALNLSFHQFTWFFTIYHTVANSAYDILHVRSKLLGQTRIRFYDATFLALFWTPRETWHFDGYFFPKQIIVYRWNQLDFSL